MNQFFEASMIFAITAAIAMMGFMGTAFGYDNTDMKVEFKTLNAGQYPSGLRLDYTIKKKDWRAIKRAGITPRLNLYTRTNKNYYDFRYSVALTARRGAIEFPQEIRLRGTRDIEIEVVGFAGFNRITRSTYGERCQPRLRINVRKTKISHVKKPKRVKRQKNDNSAELIQACGQQTSNQVPDCVARASVVSSQYAVAVVNACGTNTNFDSDFRSCIDKAAKLQAARPSAVIRACGLATSLPSELGTCLSEAQHLTGGVASTINACGVATQFNSDFRSCLQESKALGRDAAPIIRACGEASAFSSDFHECVVKSAKLRRERASFGYDGDND